MPKIADLPALTTKYLKVAMNGYAHMVLDPEMPHHRPDRIMPHPTQALDVMYSLGDGLWKERPMLHLRWLGNPHAGEIPAGKILAQEPVTSVEASAYQGLNATVTIHAKGALGSMTVVVDQGSDEAALLKEALSADVIHNHKLWMILLRK